MTNPQWLALDRDVDHTGISGTGRVAYGVRIPSGIWLLWNTGHYTAGWYPDLRTVEQIHGHDGATRITRLPLPSVPEVQDMHRLATRSVARVAVSALDLVDYFVLQPSTKERPWGPLYRPSNP